MANDEQDIKLISRNQSGFPDWLDFNKLRAEGIDHIGQLSGRIWTDHNVHDPGITTLEVLCYALLDLGYRTNLPAKDIFARDPEDFSQDDNFLTPSEILTVNPLTIMDYRKLLVDIPGVRNAWLEIATDRQADDICKRVDQPSALSYNSDQRQEWDPCCENYLNGLYHVFIETENDLDSAAAIKNKERECLLEKIKRALVAHRNICEDFLDVMFLCKWKVGVCADIDLDDNADPVKVYLEIIEKLRQFFSPSPRFYTLSQMLERKKSMDEIFAGRPLDSRDSHGFVDAGELEKIELKKTIHVSDVYHVLFTVSGIRNVKRLRLVDCKTGKDLPEWLVKVPEKNVPDLSIGCSGFSFKRSGIPISFDFKKYEALLEINFEHNGKILYSWPSNKLDAEIPRGNYHKNLGAYSSIQNEFPRVYGIAEGGLPDNVSNKRKAQALQFKGYLLFFDHLLANYLSQMQNIRSLFAVRMQKANGAGRKATYFSSLPGEVPDFQQLVQYKINGSSDRTTGETGYLAFPVSKSHFWDLLEKQHQHCINIDDLLPYRFGTSIAKDIAVSQLRDDIQNDNYEIHFLTRQDECVFYYLTSSSEDFVLVSRKYYADEKSASLAASSIRYAGTILNNYRSVHLGIDQGHSFSLELNVEDYSGFLQQLTEDDSLYHQRRGDFLQHLLARFAESFTDYALLSYPFYPSDELQKNNVGAAQRYLYNYPLLSSNRGRAFDYTTNGWYSDNNSGYEKKIKALLGSHHLGRNSLCNFEVYDYGKKYVYGLKLASSLHIKSQDTFNSEQEAIDAAGSLFDALGSFSNYHVHAVPYSQAARILVTYPHGKQAELDMNFHDTKDANNAAGYLHKMIAMPPANGYVKVVDYLFSISLRNSDNAVVRKLNETALSEMQVTKAARKVFNKINDIKVWTQSEREIGKLVVYPGTPDQVIVIDETVFKMDIDNNILGNPGLHKFELLDRGNHFLFGSVEPFTDPKQAKDACHHAMRLLAVKDHLQVKNLEGKERWSVFITENDKQIAQSSLVVATRLEAEDLKENIWKVIAPHVYYLDAEAKPHSYKFYYFFGYDDDQVVTMQSSQDYFSEPEAELAIADFCNSIERTSIGKHGNEWQLYSGAEGKQEVLLGQFPGLRQEQVKDVSHWLDVQKEIHRLKLSRNDQRVFSTYIDVKEDNQCHFTYQLVNKDGIYAVTKNRFKSKTEAVSEIQNVFSQYPILSGFLELQLSGNISEYIIQADCSKWYHYRLISNNWIPGPNEPSRKLVLFESVAGYREKADAEKAFAREYMKVLSLGSDAANYGEGKPISEKEVFDRDPSGCSKPDTIVYVPADTLAFLGAYPQQAITELVKIIKTYPLKSIQKIEQAKTFSELFPSCEKELPGNCLPPPTHSCGKEEEPPVYYFALTDKETGNVVWQGVYHYDTQAEALEAFRFFLFLLKDPLNYTVRQDCTGSYGLYIREALIESFHRFETEKLAWGKNGIQKLVTISQQPYSFHAYTDENCCFRFFVACKNNLLLHPCTYDTPEQRDRVMSQLQYYLQGILNWKFSFCREKWDGILSDFEGNIVAKVEAGFDWEPPTLFDSYLDIFSLVGNHCLVIHEKEDYVSLENDGTVLLKFLPAQPGLNLKVLKEKIEWLTCYFPFNRKTNAAGLVEFGIDIRLPGFNICEPCDDGQELCPVAWTSECSFGNCMDLLFAYYQIISWLTKYRYYKPVLDCVCGNYGIELYDDEPGCIRENSSKGTTAFELPGIVAVSPQCYHSAEMVCDAIQRAKQLINSEGLHLVEHILLRPHCLEDCDCLVQPCEDRDRETCKFPYWEIDDKDPCNDTKPVCFDPGSDPYSFIATVVLPAWPERFRNRGNQEILQNMLLREMPAHILLRVLWLSPHDMCCFESRYKKWLMWSAYENFGDNETIHCDLVRFLFNREFECLDTKQHCYDCGIETAEEEGCVEKAQKKEQELLMEYQRRAGQEPVKKKSWDEHVNDIFCWPSKNCSEDFYQACDETRQLPALAGTNEYREEHAGELVVAAPGVEKKQDKARFLNARRTHRKERLNDLIASSGESELTSRTGRFLETQTPSFVLFNKIIKELLPEKGKKANRLPARELIFMATHYYLDKISSAGDPESLSQLKPLVKSLTKSGINTGKIYQAWEPEKMSGYISAGYINMIEKLFT